MAIKTKTKEKKDRWWIFEVVDFFIGIVEILLYLPRLVFRFFKEW